MDRKQGGSRFGGRRSNAKSITPTSVYLTDAQLAMIEKAAQLEGVTVEDYLLHRGLSWARAIGVLREGSSNSTDVERTSSENEALRDANVVIKVNFGQQP